MLGNLTCDKFEIYTMFYIPGTLGQYDALVEGRVILKDGVRVDFLCINPKCQKSGKYPVTNRADQSRCLKCRGVFTKNKICC